MEGFNKNFINLYRGHGGQVDNVDPPGIPGVAGVAEDANATEACLEAILDDDRWRVDGRVIRTEGKSISNDDHLGSLPYRQISWLPNPGATIASSSDTRVSRTPSDPSKEI